MGSRPTAAVEKRYRTSPKGRATRNARQARVRAENPQKTRDWMLKKYGISQAHYDRILAAQGRACCICFRSAEQGQWKKLKVDHNHETGRVRGLLCHHCNVALGHFGDDVRFLKYAIDYLEDDGQWLEDWWLL